MKKLILIFLLMTTTVMAQETGIGVPPAIDPNEKLGDTIAWTHPLTDLNGQAITLDGFLIKYAGTRSEMGTAAEKEIALIDLSQFQDANDPNQFTYKASLSPALNGKNLCYQVVAYRSLVVDGTTSRVDSPPSSILCGTIMVRPESPKTLEIR